MDQKDFRNLPENQQLKLTFNKGRFVDSTIEDQAVFALYFFQDFYVELEFDKDSFSLSSHRIFRSGEALNKYLDWEIHHI